MSIPFFVDLRSPYTLIALKEVQRLAETHGLDLDWYPYTTPLAEAFGAAGKRDEREFRKIKYVYHQARRQARAQGLKIYGTRRIYDPTAGHVAVLQARADAIAPAFVTEALTRVFARKLEPDDRPAIRALLERLGGDGDAFEARLDGDGPAELARITAWADEQGVFGVPTLVDSDGELFFGNDSLPYLVEKLESQAG